MVPTQGSIIVQGKLESIPDIKQPASGGQEWN